jgi:oligopeptide/dipeptide ABC transporter ATP-binding protein
VGGELATGLTAAPPLLEVRGLSVDFAPGSNLRCAVDGIDLDLFPGRTLGMVGESGCGKSMTALALMGLVPPPGHVRGSVRLAGRDLLSQRERDWEQARGARLAIVFQEPLTALNPVMPIGRQIAEVLVLHERLGWRAAIERAIGLLTAVGIAAPRERARAYPHELSGGMRQRALIAMALACRPAVLIADEPTTALDVTIQAQILDLLQRLQAEMGMAILFISHNLAIIADISDTIVVMYAGRIVERVASAVLFSAPLHPYTQGLIATLPDPDRRVPRLPVIAGVVPDTYATSPGCAFAPRCPRADAACHSAPPPLRTLAPAHDVACFKAAA